MRLVDSVTARWRSLRIPLFLRLPLVAAALVLAGSIAALQFAFLAQGPDLEVRATGMGKRYTEVLVHNIEALAKANDLVGIGKAFDTELTTGEFDRTIRYHRPRNAEVAEMQPLPTVATPLCEQNKEVGREDRPAVGLRLLCCQGGQNGVKGDFQWKRRRLAMWNSQVVHD